MAGLLDDTGYTRATVLPYRTNDATGEQEFALPGLLASPMQAWVRALDAARAGRQVDPIDALEVAGAGVTGGLLAPVRAGRGVVMGAGPIRAFHSSPHDFQRFDMSKVGSGQGAQSYGHGMYFAESPSVSGRGGSYDREFTARNLGKADLNQQQEAILRLMTPGKSDSEVLFDLSKMGGIPKAADGLPDFAQAEAAIEAIKKSRSKIYEVNINADPQRLIDWDKPLFRQPYVLNALRKDDYALADNARQTGGRFVEGMLERGADPDQLSSALNQIGIPGIRYLDQGSRVAGDGSRNYVVFDDRLIDILRKYGLLPVAIGGGAVAAGGAQPGGLLEQ